MNLAKTYKFFIKVAFVALFGVALFSQCANPSSPTGGPRDTLPPAVVQMTPAYGTTNFEGKRIYIEFDEFIRIDNQVTEFFVSPFMDSKPTLTVRGRGVQVDFKDTLKADQTYAFNFGNCILDNNESNTLYGFRYVFSTGESIDSMIMSGYTVDAYTADSVSKTFILFYDVNAIDSLQGDTDSTILKYKPSVVGRAQNNGIFIAENLKPIDYRVYALDDANGSQAYEPGTDRIGYLDTVFNPSRMPSFNIWYDTTRNYMVGEPQLYFRLFYDEAFARQTFSGATRPKQHQVILDFSAKYPVIESLQFEGLDSTNFIVEYLKPTQDSISLWLNAPTEELPDTLLGTMVYLKHDTVNVLRPDTAKLRLLWRTFDGRSRREQREEERDTTFVPPNPFSFSVQARSTLNPKTHIPISFEYPLIEVDTTQISLIREGIDDKRYRVRYEFEQDTVDMRLWTLKARWMENEKYTLTIPEGAFTNVARESNDSLVASFTIDVAANYATVIVNLKGKTPESNYILQLLTKNGQLLEQKTYAKAGQHTFEYLTPGEVKIRVIEDSNSNGEWDGGNSFKRVQSERAEMFISEQGDENLVTKANWEMEFDIDANEIFYELNMENVIKQMELREKARERNAAREKANKTPQYQSTPSSLGGGGLGGFLGGEPVEE